MPHGAIILVPLTLTTLGWAASIAHDGCDYARLKGPAVAMLTGSSDVPFVDLGFTAHRIPEFYPADNAWVVAYSDECRPYEYLNVLEDQAWIAAEWLNFLSVVFGGASMMYMWVAMCLVVRPGYWRCVGLGVAVACLCQLFSFIWFHTEICHTNNTNMRDFENGVQAEESEHGQSSCSLFFGSRCAVASSCLYLMSSLVILLGEYPPPQPKLIAQDEMEKVAMVQSSRNAKGTSRRGSSVPITGRATRNLDINRSTRDLVVSGINNSSSKSQEQYRSSLRTSMRPSDGFGGGREFAGSLQSLA